MSFQRAIDSGLLRIDCRRIWLKWTQRWCPFTLSTPRLAASFTMPGSSETLISMNVSCSVTRHRLPPLAAWASLTSMNLRTLSSTVSQSDPSMTFSWVVFVAPFHDTFTSDVTGTIRSAQALAPSLGKVPLVVRLSLTPNSAHRSRISSKCL